jgi:hypothetical protein
MSTTSIIVLSDPNGGEEAFGRVFNALAAALDFKRQNRPVRLVFHGTGTRWPALLANPNHPAHALYAAIEDSIAGVSAGCATAFGARDAVEREGPSLMTANPIPGTPGLGSVAEYASAGAVLTF